MGESALEWDLQFSFVVKFHVGVTADFKVNDRLDKRLGQSMVAEHLG